MSHHCQSLRLEPALAQGEPGDGSLVAIQQLLEREEAETSEGTVTALRGERALVHRMMDAFESGALSFTRRDEKPSLGDRLNDALNANMVRHSHAVYLRYMNKAIQVAQVPPPERRSPLVRLPAAPEEEGGLARLAILFIPSTKKVLKNEALKLAHLRCAIAAVALERYRRAHGRWPESLEAVAPEYLPEWPSDPFDGEPIRCRRRMDGVALYSVGPDGVDEGGAFDRQHPTDPGSDVGFRLWDVAYRRQPASPRPTTRDR